jgi:hypothetical protein
MDGALRACHDAVKHTIARSAVGACFRVEVEVYGVFTRALLREADRRRMGAYFVREKQRLVPELNCGADSETGVRQHAPLAARCHIEHRN